MKKKNDVIGTNNGIITEELLNENMSKCNNITELSVILNTSRPTVRKYLEKYNLLDVFKERYDLKGKRIGQYDLDNNLIKEWGSISDAEETLKIFSIGKCIQGKRRSAGGYVWKEL